MRRTLFATALLLLVLVPVLAADAAPGPATGMIGLVKQTQSGMCAADDPCDGIGRGVLLVFSRVGPAGRTVSARTPTGGSRCGSRPAVTGFGQAPLRRAFSRLP